MTPRKCRSDVVTLWFCQGLALLKCWMRLRRVRPFVICAAWGGGQGVIASSANGRRCPWPKRAPSSPEHPSSFWPCCPMGGWPVAIGIGVNVVVHPMDRPPDPVISLDRLGVSLMRICNCPCPIRCPGSSMPGLERRRWAGMRPGRRLTRAARLGLGRARGYHWVWRGVPGGDPR